MPSYGIIYLVRNKTTGKVYIGRTTQPLALRWAGHVYDSNGNKGNKVNGIHDAIKRYGADDFTVEELSEHPDKRSLMLAESDAIEGYNARNPNVGYNLSVGYQGNSMIIGRDEVYSEIVKVRFTKRVFSEMVKRANVESRTLSNWIRCLVEERLGFNGAESQVELVSVQPIVAPEADHQVGEPEAEPNGSSQASSLATGGDDLSWLEGMQFDLGEG